jgi:uncharacterized membrane protein YqiK
MRSTKLTALCLALLAALMLVAAGCGSSSKNSAGTTEAATTETTTTEAATTTTTEATTTEATTTEAATTTNALGGIASASNCKELQDLGSKLSAALGSTGGTANADNIKKEADVLNEFADKAPSEIKADFKTMAAFLSKAADIYGNVTPGKVPDAATLQKLKGLQTDAAKVSTASQNIAAWAGKNCHA